MDKKEEHTNQHLEQQLSNLAKVQAQANKIKACLFTLIIYTEETRRIHYFEDIVKMITDKFPCRVIFIQGNKTSQDSYLRINTCADKVAAQMPCDQITIEAAGKQLTQVPFLILPFFVPELPIYLLWGQDPTKEGTILPHLEIFATRLVFDPECSDDLHRFSQMMLKRLENNKTELMDMNWARIGGWREVLAHTFDTAERINQLTRAKNIKIIYNKIPNPIFHQPETQALYFQAWLAAQLKWQFERMERKSDKIQLFYRFEDHPVHIVLQAQIKEDIPPEEILALEISGDEDYLCSLTRKTTSQVTVYASTQYQCNLPFNFMLNTIQSGRSFMQEVLHQKPSEQYIHMLRLISRIEGE